MEFRKQFQAEEACEAYCFSSVGQMDLSARGVEGLAVTSFMDAGNMSASSAIAKARSQREPSCIVPIFR